MSLDEYRARRQFDQTPEPEPGPVEASETRRFCIQRHQARRLHYDLRLEHGGVLKSWSVPRGPSLNPKDRRLAVHTEDHPLDYLTFQGTIPQGNYGAGSIQMWDSGTYEVLEGDFDSQYARGDLKLMFYGQRVQGAFALVRTATAPNWLWIKKKDAFVRPNWDPERLSALHQSASWWEGKSPRGQAAPMPDWVSPMLARSSEPFSDPAFAFELKWDGYRALAFVQAGKLRLLSRNGNSLLRQLPELQALTQAVRGREFILDGEVVCLDDQGVAQFQRLQSRTQAGQVAQVQRLIQAHPTTFYAFDLLYLDGQDLRGLPWQERRDLLKEVLQPSPWVRLSDAVVGEGLGLFELVQLRGLEGIVAKRRQSPYRAGRGGDWLKIKTSEVMDCVVGGQTAPEGGRRFFGSLVLGVYRGGRLQHVGNVGSGLSDDELERVARHLEPLVTPDCPFDPVPEGWRWLRPEVVVRVRYNTLTEAGILRAPVYAGIVEGADPLECVGEEFAPVQEDVASSLDTPPSGREVGTNTSPGQAAPSPGDAIPSANEEPSPRFEIGAEPSSALPHDPLNASLGPAAPSSQKIPSNQHSVAGGAVDTRAEEDSDGIFLHTPSGGVPSEPAPEVSLRLNPSSVGGLLPELQGREELILDAGGRRLKLTHLSKVLFPADGYCKRDILRYYDRVADFLLPHLKDRPLSMKRYPDGIEAHFFFQKRAYYHFPAWLPTYPLENSRGMTVETPLCNDRASLLCLVNMGCIDHNPWLSRIGSLDQPDFIMLDLDPAECEFTRLIEGARAVKELLDELGLRGFPKTSGSRGIHIYVPVAPGYEFELTRGLAHIVARLLADRYPHLFTILRSPARRAEDRVYLDAPQNRRGATTAGPYVIRPVPGALVSTPLHWDEVTPELDFRAFDLNTAPARFEQVGDLLAPVLTLQQRLEDPFVRLEKLLGGSG